MKHLRVTVEPQTSMQSNLLYISRIQSLKIPVEFSSMCTKTDKVALVDSGATENFIDY